MTSTSNQITIEWGPPVTDGGSIVLSYEVFYKLQTDSEVSWTKVATTDINTLEFTHTGLSVSADVQYRVRALTEAGFSPFSIRNTFNLAAVPSITQAPI